MEAINGNKYRKHICKGEGHKRYETEEVIIEYSKETIDDYAWKMKTRPDDNYIWTTFNIKGCPFCLEDLYETLSEEVEEDTKPMNVVHEHTCHYQKYTSEIRIIYSKLRLEQYCQWKINVAIDTEELTYVGYNITYCPFCGVDLMKTIPMVEQMDQLGEKTPKEPVGTSIHITVCPVEDMRRLYEFGPDYKNTLNKILHNTIQNVFLTKLDMDAKTKMEWNVHYTKVTPCAKDINWSEIRRKGYEDWNAKEDVEHTVEYTPVKSGTLTMKHGEFMEQYIKDMIGEEILYGLREEIKKYPDNISMTSAYWQVSMEKNKHNNSIDAVYNFKITNIRDNYTVTVINNELNVKIPPLLDKGIIGKIRTGIKTQVQESARGAIKDLLFKMISDPAATRRKEFIEQYVKDIAKEEIMVGSRSILEKNDATLSTTSGYWDLKTLMDRTQQTVRITYKFSIASLINDDTVTRNHNQIDVPVLTLNNEEEKRIRKQIKEYVKESVEGAMNELLHGA